MSINTSDEEKAVQIGVGNNIGRDVPLAASWEEEGTPHNLDGSQRGQAKRSTGSWPLQPTIPKLKGLSRTQSARLHVKSKAQDTFRSAHISGIPSSRPSLLIQFTWQMIQNGPMPQAVGADCLQWVQYHIDASE